MQVKFTQKYTAVARIILYKNVSRTAGRHFYTICPRNAYLKDSIMALKAGRLRRIMSLDTQ